jgi:8-oxo-dGTP diphosphatase
MDAYITRPNMKSRALDAMRHLHLIPYESWEVRPHLLVERIDPDVRD